MKPLIKKLIRRLAYILLKENYPVTKCPPLIADSFFYFWQHVYQHLLIWQDCEVLLTCPMTYSGARTQFPDKNIVLIADVAQLALFYLEKRNSKFEYVGIFSPELCLALYRNQSLLTCFMQLCRRAMMMVVFPNPEMSTHHRLLMLHATGFQQIHTIVTENKKLISQNYFPLGDYFYSSQSPELPSNTEWGTQVAYRMIHLSPDTYPWRVYYGQIMQDDENRLKAFAQQYALGIMSVPEHLALSTRIDADFCWTAQSKHEAGHASLVACYTGPGDTKMYVLLVILTKTLNPHVHLYKNTGEWILMDSKILSPEEFTSQGNLNSVNLWLEVSETQLKAGTKDKLLLDINDVDLPRTGGFGIRFLSDDIAVTNPRIIAC